MARLDRFRRRLPLLLLLVMASAFRLQYIGAPLLDAHRWRQVDTAAIARFFYEDEFNPLKPRVNWGGPEGYVESEFPLLPALVAGLYLVFGPADSLGRIVVVLFSLGTVVLTYSLGRALMDRSAGLAAAALVAASPAAVFYGRTFMPDTLMVFFSVATILLFHRYTVTCSSVALLTAGASLGLAILVKLPGVLALAPVAAVLWIARGRTLLTDVRLLTALALPVAVAAAWYWHAYEIYRDTGLTFGVFGTTKTYPAYVAGTVWTDAFSKWSSLELLTSASFYQTLISRLYFLHLTPVGFALAVLGLLVWRREQWRWVPGAWLVAMVAFILVAGAGHMGHDYYQLPLVPIGALYFAAVARPVFDPGWIRATIGAGLVPRVGVGVVIGILAVVGLWHSGVVERHFRPDSLDVRIQRAGQAIERATEPGTMLVVVDDYGVNSPMLLYFAHRKGWSLDPSTATAWAVGGLHSRGARYFATTRWARIRRGQPELETLLRTRRAVPLPGAPADTVLFDLSAPPRAEPPPPAETPDLEQRRP